MASPGLNEIATTTQRNRSMKGEAKKAHKDVLKSGTHVPEKDFSSKKKEDKADKGGKIASLKVSKLPPMSMTTVGPSEHSENKYEGSSKDWQQDYHGAKRKGMTVEQYEGSAKDRIEDAAGQKHMDAEEGAKEHMHHSDEYKKGGSHFSNTPKAAHTFRAGHVRDGHHRNSGHPGAHRIGKR